MVWTSTDFAQYMLMYEIWCAFATAYNYRRCGAWTIDSACNVAEG